MAHHHEVTALARPELDLSDLASLERLVKSLDYDILVNAAASTNVDRCETERDEATTVNATAVGLLARLAAERDARLIHISTDYVFDGEKDTPYVESDEALPLGHYGQTKLDGERLALAASPRHVVARVSWVFGPDKPSFVDMIVDRALKNPASRPSPTKPPAPPPPRTVRSGSRLSLTPPPPAGFTTPATPAPAPGRSTASMRSIAPSRPCADSGSHRGTHSPSLHEGIRGSAAAADGPAYRQTHVGIGSPASFVAGCGCRLHSTKIPLMHRFYLHRINGTPLRRSSTRANLTTP